MVKKAGATSKGFERLAKKHFNGDCHQARQWVADLGRAAYFWYVRPAVSISILAPYKRVFPHLFECDGNLIVGINWKSEQMRQRAGKGPIT
jgi:hypothetical protein